MKALTSAFAVTLGAAFISVGVAISPPVRADRCDQFRPPGAPPNSLWLACEHDNLVDSGKHPVCYQGGTGPDCPACTTALGTNGQPYLRAAWACGAPGREGYYDDTFPCYVDSVAHPTNQPGCDGMMLRDGSIRRGNGNITQATGPATQLP
jgi:hypothetical protein